MLCLECNKKKHFLLNCKCGNKYCVNHISKHNCKYDYFIENKKNITISNPTIKSNKINIF